MALTRGRLVAREGALEGRSVDFLFNPTEYSVKKTNNWTFQNKPSENVPAWEFGGGGPRELSLELLFDTSLPRPGVAIDAVRQATNLLFAFMTIDVNLKATPPTSRLGRPPKCLLEWGRDTPFQFECYVTDCSVKFMLFSGDGEPIRAMASLTLKEVSDPANLARQNPTSGGDPGARVYVVKAGDRIDVIAYRVYGDATLWRPIAQANDLPDPLDLRPGQTLSIPPL
jgi:Contractile injection system tube protein/LysM domain